MKCRKRNLPKLHATWLVFASRWLDFCLPAGNDKWNITFQTNALTQYTHTNWSKFKSCQGNRSHLLFSNTYLLETSARTSRTGEVISNLEVKIALCLLFWQKELDEASRWSIKFKAVCLQPWHYHVLGLNQTWPPKRQFHYILYRFPTAKNSDQRTNFGINLPCDEWPM